MKRTISFLLALLLCTSVLVGCGGSNEEQSSDTISTDTMVDEIGDYNFESADFTILTRKETSYEHIGEFGEESVSSAVYQRNVAVSERFNVNLKVVELDGGWETKDTFVTTLRAEGMTSTSSYDLVSTHSVYLGWLGAEGLLADLSTLEKVDLTKEYWNQNLYNELNIDGSCYIMIGDIAHTLYEYINVIFVNTKILEDNQFVEGGVEGIYDMIDNGTWTWDELYELSKKFGTGKDIGGGIGDGKYGLIFGSHPFRASMISQEANIYQKDADGKFTMPPSANERMIDAVLKISRFFGTASNSYFLDGWYFYDDRGGLEPTQTFIENKALFYAQILGESKNLSGEMGEGYAVLPLPKYNTEQSNYYTSCYTDVTGVAVLENVKDKKMSGVITQALALYGSEYVTPEYYERALKYRYASDPRCPEILDKIRASLTIDAVPTFYETSVDIDMFRDIVALGQSDGISSKYETYVSQGDVELKNFYLQIEILKD